MPFGVELITGIVIVTLLITLVAARFCGRRLARDAWNAGLANSAETGLVVQASGSRAVGAHGGIYLGWSVGHPKGQRPLELAYIGDRHIVTFGPNCVDKSMRLLYENLIRLKRWSVVVVDPNGDLARVTIDMRKAMGSEIVVLDPFGVSGFSSDGYNPIAALAGGENLPDDARALAEAIIKSEGRDPHWGALAQDLVAACIMHIRLNDPDTGSFEQVRTILASDIARLRVHVAAMQMTADANEMPQLDAKAARYADINAESRELLSVLSTALTQTG